MSVLQTISLIVFWVCAVSFLTLVIFAAKRWISDIKWLKSKYADIAAALVTNDYQTHALQSQLCKSRKEPPCRKHRQKQ